MARRRKKHKPPGEVQINLAAMLDMAFQLLAFFILTFRPAPIEGHFQLHMPPPSTTSTDVVESTESPNPSTGEPPPFVETLDLMIRADSRGQVTSIEVGRDPVVAGRLTQPAIQQLNTKLRSSLKDAPYDRIQLHVDRRLHYEELMKIVDVCTRQTLPDGTPMRQVGFMELANQGE
jgi:biopolymer transport protein ExbD